MNLVSLRLTCLALVVGLVVFRSRAAAEDIVFADFEGETYGDWKTTGTAFGTGPARGTLPDQMDVSGFQGKGLVNSYVGKDESQGTLTSPEFKLERPYIAFLIGGGGHEGKTCVNLLVDGKVVRTATGSNLAAGGSERLEPSGWDVRDLAGKSARIVVVDAERGGWGHINLDHIVFTDTRPRLPLIGATRELTASERWLWLPVKTGGPMRKVTVAVAGKVERFFDIELADGEPDWWAALDIASFQGKSLTVRVDKLASDSQALAQLKQAADEPQLSELYRETLRPQFHFSARRGWINDPNGLVHYNGEYHLFYQHNPYGWAWGNMHWGHAVSRDLVHWQEQGEALYPDALGPMFSGGAVVDWKNTSGFGKDGKPPLVLFYTAAGNPTVQCLAYSTDGRTFTKYEKNPILKEITPGNRDPKVIWHEPSQHWVMTLYVEKDKKHWIQFFTSKDLKVWTFASENEGYFECPEFFELPLDGDPKHKLWVLTAANSEYQVGAFDGKKFTPYTAMLPGHKGKGFYAAQTFSDEPQGRRIQIGWGQMPSPGMAFNQLQLFPCELTLHRTKDGPRLKWNPVTEIEKLRGQTWKVSQTLKPGDENPLAAAKGDLWEVSAKFRPTSGAKLALDVRGVTVEYDAAKQELSVAGQRTFAPLQEGQQDLVILLDRTCIEVFAAGGLVYVPLPTIAPADNQGLTVQAIGGDLEVDLSAHRLRPIWGR